jgi:energy-coupling factor transport system substrate-specific component
MLHKQRLVGKDFINIGIFSVLILVIFLVVAIPFMPFLAVAFPFIGGISALVTAPIFMLMTHKVAKQGTILLCCTILALIYTFMGYVYLLPFGILSGLLCEAVMRKRGAYRSFWNNAVCFSIFSVMLFVLSCFLPIYIFGSAYYLNLLSNTAESAIVHIHYALSPLWVVFIVALTVVMAVVGCFIGRRMLKKHFIKAGLISSE